MTKEPLFVVLGDSDDMKRVIEQIKLDEWCAGNELHIEMAPLYSPILCIPPPTIDKFLLHDLLTKDAIMPMQAVSDAHLMRQLERLKPEYIPFEDVENDVFIHPEDEDELSRARVLSDEERKRRKKKNKAARKARKKNR